MTKAERRLFIAFVRFMLVFGRAIGPRGEHHYTPVEEAIKALEEEQYRGYQEQDTY